MHQTIEKFTTQHADKTYGRKNPKPTKQSPSKTVFNSDEYTNKAKESVRGS